MQTAFPHSDLRCIQAVTASVRTQSGALTGVCACVFVGVRPRQVMSRTQIQTSASAGLTFGADALAIRGGVG